MPEFSVIDSVDGWSGQAFTLEEVNQAVSRIREYAEQEGYDPEFQVWVRLT
jgi:hypothetical protein